MNENVNAPVHDAPNHPPLARDAQGNLIELPKGTAAWRIARQTTGRPRVLSTPDNQPLRFPLSTTCEQLVDTCGPDTYHVYAIDEFGNVLGHVVKVDAARETRDARDLRNAATTDASIPQASRSAHAQMTDLRFALETMAHMMRTNSDALRAVTESQADWVKAIAMAKGLPRNAAYPGLAQRRPVDEYDDHDDDDDSGEVEQTDSEEEEAPLGSRAATNAYDVVCKAIDKFGDFIPGEIVGKLVGGNGAPVPKKKAAPIRNGSSASTNAAAASSDIDWNLVNAPDWERRDLTDLDYSHRKGKAKRAARALQEERTAPQATPTPATAPSSRLVARIARDPALLQHLEAIKTQVTPEDAQLAINAVMQAPPDAQDDLIEKLTASSVEQGAEWCRSLAADIKKHGEQTQPAPDGAAA
jgi:hypothetical protein